MEQISEEYKTEYPIFSNYFLKSLCLLHICLIPPGGISPKYGLKQLLHSLTAKEGDIWIPRQPDGSSSLRTHNFPSPLTCCDPWCQHQGEGMFCSSISFSSHFCPWAWAKPDPVLVSVLHTQVYCSECWINSNAQHWQLRNRKPRKIRPDIQFLKPLIPHIHVRSQYFSRENNYTH